MTDKEFSLDDDRPRYFVRTYRTEGGRTLVGCPISTSAGGRVAVGERHLLPRGRHAKRGCLAARSARAAHPTIWAARSISGGCRRAWITPFFRAAAGRRGPFRRTPLEGPSAASPIRSRRRCSRVVAGSRERPRARVGWATARESSRCRCCWWSCGFGWSPILWDGCDARIGPARRWTQPRPPTPCEV